MKSSITAQVERVTPALAAAWLKENTSNRPVSDSHVRFLSGVLRRDEYRLNGEPIIFNGNGELLDGQHRLKACVETGATFESLIVRGVPKDAFATMGECKPRTFGDKAALSGEKFGNQLGAAIRAAFVVIEGRGLTTYSHQQLFSMLERHPRLRYWNLRYGSSMPIRKVAKSMVIAVLALGEELHGTEKAEEFFDLLSSGANMDEHHPVLVLRNRLLENRITKVSRLTQTTELAFLIKAWNAFVTGKATKIIRYRHDDEPFPNMVIRSKS